MAAAFTVISIANSSIATAVHSLTNLCNPYVNMVFDDIKYYPMIYVMFM